MGGDTTIQMSLDDGNVTSAWECLVVREALGEIESVGYVLF